MASGSSRRAAASGPASRTSKPRSSTSPKCILQDRIKGPHGRCLGNVTGRWSLIQHLSRHPCANFWSACSVNPNTSNSRFVRSGFALEGPRFASRHLPSSTVRSRIKSRRRNPSPSTALPILRPASRMMAHARSSPGSVFNGNSRMKLACLRGIKKLRGGSHVFKGRVGNRPSGRCAQPPGRIAGARRAFRSLCSQARRCPEPTATAHPAKVRQIDHRTAGLAVISAFVPAPAMMGAWATNKRATVDAKTALIMVGPHLVEIANDVRRLGSGHAAGSESLPYPKTSPGPRSCLARSIRLRRKP
jgi:hypothetical protein